MDQSEQQTSGRSISVRAKGSSAGELELDALDKARAFFGSDMRLEVVYDYQAAWTEHPAPGYTAVVIVREVR